MRRLFSLAAVSALSTSLLYGCSQPRPVMMAPPVGQGQGYATPQQGGYQAPPVGNMGNGGSMGNAGNASNGAVYQWQDVPPNQEVPISRATFDQGGYQIFAQSGETIVVPFVNNNLYAMKFGRTNGQAYFRNENGVPVLYLRPGDGLENAAAQGARWFPIPQDYAYTQPMYVALAPSWNEYTGMGWYPGMNYYGGMWGYSPYSHFAWMPGFYINVGGHRYTQYNSYTNYYRSTPGYVRTRVVYNNYSSPRGVTGRSFGTGSSSGGFGRSTGSTGSFGSGRASGGSNSTFGNRPGSSSGSFGSGRSTGSMGSSTPAVGGGRTGGTFGSGSSGYSTTPRGGSSFGSGRTSGSSGFGGGRSSGSSSFGSGGGRSSGSFGGGRRR